jgi:hypothetical protein
MHGLTDQVFTQHRPQRSATISVAGKGRQASALELQVVEDSIATSAFAKEDRTAIAQLRHEATELVSRVGHSDRVCILRQLVSGKQRRRILFHHVGVQPQLLRQTSIEDHHVRIGDGRRDHAAVELRRQTRVAVCET